MTKEARISKFKPAKQDLFELKVIEVPVSRVKRQTMLQHQRGQPYIVGRNRRSLRPELTEHGGVVMSGLVVGK